MVKYYALFIHRAQRYKGNKNISGAVELRACPQKATNLPIFNQLTTN